MLTFTLTVTSPATYTVSYNANGGAGAPASQTKTYGVTLTLSKTAPTRTGYTFLGWATSSTATTAAYKAGGSYTANASATLYAVWKISYAAPTVVRMGGADRYETAVLIAKQGWKTSDTVLLAYSMNYPDALAGVTLASALNAPILLTDAASTPGATMTEVRSLKAKNIILLGGVGVISAAQETALKNAGYKVTRYGGTNRYGTAQLIGNAVENLGGSKTAVLATGMDFPDALVMSSYAGMQKMPMIFADKNSLPTETQSFIKNNKITKVVVVNDAGSIGAAVITQVKNLVGAANVTVITASDRYDLSAKVANQYKSSFANGVAVATGANFPDALTGGVLAAKMEFPVMLLNPATGATAAEKAYVKSLSGPQIYVFGGTGVVSDSAVLGLYK